MTTPWQPGFQGVTVTPPGYNDPHNWAPASAFQLVAATPQAGFALVNGTPNIISWTAPNDNQNHVVLVFGSLHVTTAETGGAISLNYAPPSGATSATLSAGGSGGGTFPFGSLPVVVGPGTTVSVQQSSALTLGAATAWSEIWAA